MDLDHLVEDVISEDLAATGFKRRGRNFHRESGDFFHLIAFGRGRQMMQGRFAISFYAHPKFTNAPGLPELPPRAGEYWFRRRVAPNGLEDQWWSSDGILDQTVAEIRKLLGEQQQEWFRRLDSFEHFAQDWYLREVRLDDAARQLGLLPARLAYLSALGFAQLGLEQEAYRIAGRALDETGPRATTLRAWINAFRQSLEP